MMNFLKKTFVLIFASIFFSVFFLVAHAQIPDTIDSLTITTIPENPQSNQPVTVELSSYNTDLNAATIVWSLDNKVVLSASGKTSITIKAPASGKSTVVSANIRTAEGRDVKKSITITVNNIELIWETDGYVPPFFRGKSIIAYQNHVKIIAIPHFIEKGNKEINPNNLTYVWKKDGKVLQSQSGYGKQSLIVPIDNIPRPFNINVDINSRDGSLRGQAFIDVDETDPFVLFYPEDPLYGVLYNTPLNSRFRLPNKEIKIVAAPFSFNRGDSASMSYVWSINNEERPELGNNRTATLRVKEDAEGSSDIDLEVRNQENILQGAHSNFSAFYSKQNAEVSDTSNKPTF